MATLREERARLQFLEEKGCGDEKVHIVFVEREAQERIVNEKKGFTKPKTRFQVETDAPEMYSRFNLQKDRWYRLIPNKSVCLDLMCRMWEEPGDETIASFGADDSDAQKSF